VVANHHLVQEDYLCGAPAILVKATVNENKNNLWREQQKKKKKQSTFVVSHYPAGSVTFISYCLKK